MSLEGDIVARLLADGAVSAVVGTSIYVESAPQSTDKPYITIQIISTANHHHLGGGGVPSAQSRVQIDAWCTKPSERATLVEAIRQSLQGLKTDIVAAGTRAKGIGFNGPANSYIQPPDGSDLGTFRGLCEAVITHDVPSV